MRDSTIRDMIAKAKRLEALQILEITHRYS